MGPARRHRDARERAHGLALTPPIDDRGPAGSTVVHLVDGTYELYRQHYGTPAKDGERPPYAATAGALASTLRLVADGATHVAVATDHVIESFRNDLWPGYKTSEGMEPELLEQIPILEEALRAMGVAVFAMEREEADDGLAAAAAGAAADASVTQVRILTPDKDLGQCIAGRRVIQVDRRTGTEVDEAALRERLGIGPSSVPDYLALVGDASDGFPGLRGWGERSASAVLGRYATLEAIPEDPARWTADGVAVRGAARLAATLRDGMADALLFRTLATLRTDLPVGSVADWRWWGPQARFRAVAADLGSPALAERAERLASDGGG
ncbi:MAG: 5'-3' exonuclease H3TH domain-containing protein [Actinomycetota bacterium]